MAKPKKFVYHNMLSVSVYLDYGYGPAGFGTYVYKAPTHEILLFIKDK